MQFSQNKHSLKKAIAMRHAHNRSSDSRTSNTSIAHSTALLLTAVVATSLAPTASANLLSNPGFEISAFTSAANVLTNFSGFQGVWGPEVGGITFATGGVTPAAGVNMLEMNDDGASYTQAFQTVDVSSFSTMINAGSATVNGSALFNTVGGYTGAFSAVNVSFFSGNSYGTLLGNSGSGTLNLDANPLTWERHGCCFKWRTRTHRLETIPASSMTHSWTSCPLPARSRCWDLQDCVDAVVATKCAPTPRLIHITHQSGDSTILRASRSTDRGELPSALLLVMIHTPRPAVSAARARCANASRLASSGSTSASNGS